MDEILSETHQDILIRDIGGAVNGFFERISTEEICDAISEGIKNGLQYMFGQHNMVQVSDMLYSGIGHLLVVIQQASIDQIKLTGTEIRYKIGKLVEESIEAAKK